MNWVDLLVIVVAVLAALSGARQGVLVALPAFVGVVAGAVAGIRLAPIVIEFFEHPAAKVAFAFGTVVFLVALGETFGVWIGRTIKERIRSPQLHGVDNAVGAVVQGAAMFVVAWLFGATLTAVSGLPGLTAAINQSVVLGEVNDLMPQKAHALPRDLRKLLDQSGLPQVMEPFQRQPSAEVRAPNRQLQNSAVVRRVKPSVLKIRGDAPSCSRRLEGSGFVVAPERVMTNAHVVAGTSSVQVETDNGPLGGRVVYFDPDTDVAIIAVPGLTAPILPLESAVPGNGASAIVLGYPLDGPYVATAARIRQRIDLRGPDIYESKTVRRDVLTIRGTVKSGNSGGPMISPEGRVVGLVFGASVQDPDTGFTLTSQEIEPEALEAHNMSREVGTGPCTS